MTEERHHIFISHVHEDDARLAEMKELLAANGFEVRDSSINSSKPNDAKDPDYIKGQILAPHIQWAGTLITLVSPETKNSEWVDWEIEYANKHGKRIVGVWAHGAGDCDIPEALDLYADAVVGWQAQRIIDAIRGDFNNWENPDGTPRTAQLIARHSC